MATTSPRDWSSTTILYIAHDWDPVHETAESLASRRLAAALLDAGATLHVVAASRPDDDFPSPRYHLTVVPDVPFARSRLGRALEMLRTTIPEAEGRWLSHSVPAAEAILRDLPQNTIIYSRTNPGVSNITGWRLARATRRPWVAHFSDEWPARYVLAGGRKWLAPYKGPLFSWWRRRIVRDAGALTFTNSAQAAEVLGTGSARYRAKSFVVTHLASPTGRAPRPQQYDSFHIVHTGNFYPREHTAATLVQGVRLFLDGTPRARQVTRLTQAGWANGDLPEWARRCQLQHIMHYTGRLDVAAVLALIDTASLLVAVDYARPRSTTVLSKLPDYINAQRPILAITALDSSLARVFRDDGAGLTAPHGSPADVAAQIGAVFEAWTERKRDAFLPSAAAIESFSIRSVLSELAGALHVASAATATGNRDQRSTLAASAGPVWQ